MNMNRVPRNMVTYDVSMYIVRRDDDGRNANIQGDSKFHCAFLSRHIHSIANLAKSMNRFEHLHWNICF